MPARLSREKWDTGVYCRVYSSTSSYSSMLGLDKKMQRYTVHCTPSISFVALEGGRHMSDTMLSTLTLTDGGHESSNIFSVVMLSHRSQRWISFDLVALFISVVAFGVLSDITYNPTNESQVRPVPTDAESAAEINRNFYMNESIARHARHFCDWFGTTVGMTQHCSLQNLIEMWTKCMLFVCQTNCQVYAFCLPNKLPVNLLMKRRWLPYSMLLYLYWWPSPSKETEM